MKTRNGFVSNSSTSSFIVSKKSLTTMQIFLIMNYDLVSEFLLEHNFTNKELLKYAGGWDITETETEVKGDTIMDNFDMQGFMQQIGIPMDLVKGKSGNCGHW